MSTTLRQAVVALRLLVVMTVVLGSTDDVAECAFVQSSKSPGVRALAAISRVH